MIIYIHGPPGCGKTRNRDRFKAAFFADQVVEIEHVVRVRDKADKIVVVVLGNKLEHAPQDTWLIYEFEAAMRVAAFYEEALRTGKTHDELRGTFAAAMLELAAQARVQKPT